MNKKYCVPILSVIIIRWRKGGVGRGVKLFSCYYCIQIIANVRVGVVTDCSQSDVEVRVRRSAGQQ